MRQQAYIPTYTTYIIYVINISSGLSKNLLYARKNSKVEQLNCLNPFLIIFFICGLTSKREMITFHMEWKLMEDSNHSLISNVNCWASSKFLLPTPHSSNKQMAFKNFLADKFLGSKLFGGLRLNQTFQCHKSLARLLRDYETETGLQRLQH